MTNFFIPSSAVYSLYTRIQGFRNITDMSAISHKSADNKQPVGATRNTYAQSPKVIMAQVMSTLEIYHSGNYFTT